MDDINEIVEILVDDISTYPWVGVIVIGISAILIMPGVVLVCCYDPGAKRKGRTPS